MAYCLVRTAGVNEDGKVQIKLKDKKGTFDADFLALDSVKKEMLATALAAMTAGWTVWAEVSSTGAGSTLKRLIAIGLPDPGV